MSIAPWVRDPRPSAVEPGRGAPAKKPMMAMNKNLATIVEWSRELAMVKEMIINQKQAYARAKALKDLRSRNRIELLQRQ